MAMDHAAPHGSATIFTLLMIPLIIWLRLRRMRRSAKAQDFWFEPEGDHFIYHPFGRFGGAFLVTSETRTAIRARLSSFTRVAGIVLLLVILGPALPAQSGSGSILAMAPVVPGNAAGHDRGAAGRWADLAGGGDPAALRGRGPGTPPHRHGGCAGAPGASAILVGGRHRLCRDGRPGRLFPRRALWPPASAQ